MKIGIMSSAFGKMELNQLAAAMESYGFRTTHLNLKASPISIRARAS